MKERDKRVKFFLPQFIFVAKEGALYDSASFLVENLDKSGRQKPYIEEYKYDEDKVLIFYDDVKRIEKNVIGE